ncbi:hypothetical protein GALMADRAFT_147282 [Galerina marginata CBS 339.88]|uniref:Uncharacterized protein n=1 Tax=Galerina marginata (strain CBS 339.88) TaxID=685588 RepID=A0A067SKI5_GALM3|nr:hypothetical protein GALMADRAFT_147282 [Galerina marginata CBS 339.88]
MSPQHSHPFEMEQLLGTAVSDKTHRVSNDEMGTPFRVKTAFTFHWFYATHGILFILCGFFFTTSMRNRGQCVEIPYSPANIAIEYQQEFTIFNGSFRFPSVYRGDPTPELDEAWHRISKGVSLVRLTREELLKLGKEDTPSKVKFTEEDGGGYLAFIEVAHELHCLVNF